MHSLLPASFSKLPGNVKELILSSLATRSRLIIGFVCADWLEHVWKDYAKVSDLCIELSDLRCGLGVSANFQQATGTYKLELTLCQCYEHIAGHLNATRQILTHAVDSVKRLFVQDALIKPDSFIQPDLLYWLLDSFDFLDSVEFLDVNLARIPLDCLWRLTRLRHLNHLTIKDCCSDNGQSPYCFHINDRQLYGLSMCGQLQELHLNSCSDVTDIALKALSRYCPNLKHVDLTNCPKITALGIYFFIKYMSGRHIDLSSLIVTKTSVRSSELERLLLSGTDGNDWSFVQFRLDELGQNACCVSNRRLPSKVVLVLVDC